MVQAECRERARSSYAEATPIDAEWNGSPKGKRSAAIIGIKELYLLYLLNMSEFMQPGSY